MVQQHRLIGLFALAIAAVAAAGCLAPAPQSETDGTVPLVFEHARILTGEPVGPLEDFRFVVQGGRFSRIGPPELVEIPPGAKRIDLTGKTVMPAIIDTHTHLSQTRTGLIADLKRRAYFGVGAAMSLGQDAGDAAFQVRTEPIPGAALLRTAGRGITMPEPGRSTSPYWISTEAEARRAVSELATRKVDIVKIWVDDRNHQHEKLTPELYRAIIDEAHRNGLRVTAHIFNLSDAKDLLRAGVDAFAHGIRDRELDKEALDLFARHPRVVLVPNLPDRGEPADVGWLLDRLAPPDAARAQASAGDRDEMRRMFEVQARNLARLHAAGVTIALGTDGNTPWAPHLEMADMVAAGMSPAEVIVAATRNGAGFLRLNGVGTIAAGQSADFLVLEADPLIKIENTRRIAAIFLRGVELDRSAPLPGAVE